MLNAQKYQYIARKTHNKNSLKIGRNQFKVEYKNLKCQSGISNCKAHKIQLSQIFHRKLALDA